MTFQLGTPQTWIAVAACAAWYILLYVIIACCFPVIPTITLDIIEHQCQTKDVKETVRNVWTNIALVAALIDDLHVDRDCRQAGGRLCCG